MHFYDLLAELPWDQNFLLLIFFCSADFNNCDMQFAAKTFFFFTALHAFLNLLLLNIIAV